MISEFMYLWYGENSWMPQAITLVGTICKLSESMAGKSVFSPNNELCLPSLCPNYSPLLYLLQQNMESCFNLFHILICHFKIVFPDKTIQSLGAEVPTDYISKCHHWLHWCWDVVPRTSCIQEPFYLMSLPVLLMQIWPCQWQKITIPAVSCE